MAIAISNDCGVNEHGSIGELHWGTLRSTRRKSSADRLELTSSYAQHQSGLKRISEKIGSQEVNLNIVHLTDRLPPATMLRLRQILYFVLS